MAKPRRLAARQQRALERLRRARLLSDFYLGGGAAVDLHLGHRRSIDLDFFSLSPDLDLTAIERRLLRAVPQAAVIAKSDAALRIKIEGVPVDIVVYPYPPLETPRESERGLRVAGLIDLAVMKLAVAAQRGLRRDYWDLYEILKSGIDIRDAGDAFLKRFGKGESDLYHVARAISFFEDTEKDPHLPRGLTQARWRAIKKYLLEQAPRLLELAASDDRDRGKARKKKR